MLYLTYVMAAIAIVIMVLNTVRTLRLRNMLIGGEVGARWNVLSVLVVVFLAGFILSPLLLVLNVPVEYLLLAVFSVFLLGAIFVGLVVRIVRDILQVMDLLEE